MSRIPEKAEARMNVEHQKIQLTGVHPWCALQEDREWALRKGLQEINKEIEAASRNGVACWFPMGTRNERIVRLAADEAQLLNSRCVHMSFLLVWFLKSLEADVHSVCCSVLHPGTVYDAACTRSNIVKQSWWPCSEHMSL